MMRLLGDDVLEDAAFSYAYARVFISYPWPYLQKVWTSLRGTERYDAEQEV